MFRIIFDQTLDVFPMCVYVVDELTLTMTCFIPVIQINVLTPCVLTLSPGMGRFSWFLHFSGLMVVVVKLHPLLLDVFTTRVTSRKKDFFLFLTFYLNCFTCSSLLVTICLFVFFR